MNLEAYRKKVQRRLVWMCVLAVAFAVLTAIASKLGSGFTSDYLWGMGMGGGFVALFVLFQQGKSLQDDQKLRKLYIMEHDERMRAIRAKAGQPIVAYLSVGMAAAAVIASCFNLTVAATLAITALVQVAVCLVVKFICMKRM